MLPKSLQQFDSARALRLSRKSESQKHLESVGDGVRADRVANPRTFKVIDTGGSMANIAGQTAAGQAAYNSSGVASVCVPMGNSALARTIRHHELLHANCTPTRLPRGWKKYSPFTLNGIEDCRVHLAYWNPAATPGQLNRDCLSVGLRDLRKLQQHKGQVGASPATYNSAIVEAVRSFAIVSQFAKYKYMGYPDYIAKARRLLRDTFGELVMEGIVDICELADSGTKRKHHIEALDLLESLIMPPNAPPLRLSNGKGSGAFHESTKADKVVQSKADYNNYAALDRLKPMNIVELPRPIPNSKQAPKSSPCRYGARLRASRIVPAIITGSTAGLFLRRRRVESSLSILFDASGSMGVTIPKLESLCVQSPGSTVAYYSGRTTVAYYSGRTTGGTLGVFARDGRRAMSIPEHTLHSGNTVDYWAIRWLLQQPGPRIFVSDGGFGGSIRGDDGQAVYSFAQATALIQSAVASGDVARWYKSFAEFATDCGFRLPE